MTPDTSARAYRSELRAKQARGTRRRIVEAAARLFAERGYQATTLTAIARDAGVSTETVKTAAPKAELLIAAFEVVFAGEESAQSLTDTEVGSGILDLPDELLLDAVVGQIAVANARGHALWTVLLGAAASDPVVDTALQAILARRAEDYRRLVGELIARGYAPAVTDPHATAAVLSFLLSPESYQQLVAQSGWSSERYVAWLRGAVLAELAR
ncbi:TetR family transcriptional regulator [Microbacterium sp. M3]|uniref:TetR family transcriptional regulator n=1 Tax=Microbacterium arthrosphaerae TaxID=792652 RepID=A0ABU4H4J0_9MICO|nr:MULTISPECIES: TetR family transcriptional regulator [Microbacterium]MDW4574251.1 TetR family transcriptional regulator [Microbacterium arthrosphaerae]MDW7608106.1 TetR family transcriptional regulator [Microbacterium sp. M3]